MATVLLESVAVLVLVGIVFAKIQNRIIDDSNDQVRLNMAKGTLNS